MQCCILSNFSIKTYGKYLGVSWGFHWRREWQPTPVFLPGESQESLVGHNPHGHKEPARQGWVTFSHALRFWLWKASVINQWGNFPSYSSKKWTAMMHWKQQRHNLKPFFKKANTAERKYCQRLKKANHPCGSLVLLDETVDYGMFQFMVFAMCCFSGEKYKELLFVSY